jgi:DNA-binding PadR family transcriptional regulator
VAKRRKVGNILGLAVLSIMQMGPMHPYEVATRLREYGKDQDMNIKWGSLYTVVQNLEKHGFLAVAESARQGGRPERTVYRLTDEGRAELVDWVRELIAVPEREFPRFEAGLSVIAVVGPDEAVELLTARVAALQGQLTTQREVLAGATGVPRIFLIEAEYDLAVRDAELVWVRSLLAELTGGTMPGIEEWRAYHQTGQLPDEFRELQERGITTDAT